MDLMKQRQLTRRSIFGGLSLAGVLLVGKALLGKSLTGAWPSEDKVFGGLPEGALLYKGYQIFWSGWVRSQSTAALVGVWKAWPMAHGQEKPFLYAACPGQQGAYNPGDYWNLTLGRIQQVIEKETPERIKLAAEREGLIRLIALIDERDG